MGGVTDASHLHDAFKLGCTLIELKSRIAVAARQRSDTLGPSIRLSSVWRAGFGQLAMLLKGAFPTAATAGTRTWLTTGTPRTRARWATRSSAE